MLRPGNIKKLNWWNDGCMPRTTYVSWNIDKFANEEHFNNALAILLCKFLSVTAEWSPYCYEISAHTWNFRKQATTDCVNVHAIRCLQANPYVICSHWLRLQLPANCGDFLSREINGARIFLRRCSHGPESRNTQQIRKQFCTSKRTRHRNWNRNEKYCAGF